MVTVQSVHMVGFVTTYPLLTGISRDKTLQRMPVWSKTSNIAAAFRPWFLWSQQHIFQSPWRHSSLYECRNWFNFTWEVQYNSWGWPGNKIDLNRSEQISRIGEKNQGKIWRLRELELGKYRNIAFPMFHFCFVSSVKMMAFQCIL